MAKGVPVTTKLGRVKFEEAAQDLENDYITNGKRCLVDIRRRIDKHLKLVSGGRRMTSITTSDIRKFQKQRQEAGASHGEINRELSALRRMFSLAYQDGKIMTWPFSRC